MNFFRIPQIGRAFKTDTIEELFVHRTRSGPQEFHTLLVRRTDGTSTKVADFTNEEDAWQALEDLLALNSEMPVYDVRPPESGWYEQEDKGIPMALSACGCMMPVPTTGGRCTSCGGKLPWDY